jgi:hypothetical protein
MKSSSLGRFIPVYELPFFGLCGGRSPMTTTSHGWREGTVYGTVSAVLEAESAISRDSGLLAGVLYRLDYNTLRCDRAGDSSVTLDAFDDALAFLEYRSRNVYRTLLTKSATSAQWSSRTKLPLFSLPAGGESAL